MRGKLAWQAASASDLDTLRAKLTSVPPAVRELNLCECYFGDNEGGLEAWIKFARDCLPGMANLRELQ